MKRRTSKFVTTSLSSALLVSALAGCSGGKTSEPSSSTAASSPVAATEAKTGIDTSKKVELQFYMLGDAPKDLPTIEAEINKLAEKDLNATVKFNYTTWTDWQQKYRLLLSSGQQVDLIFTAEWTEFQSYAKKGAFLPLDDLLPKAAPELTKFIPKDMWEAVKIDKKIYTMPATFKEYVTNGYVWREDLRAKYNLPKPTNTETFEAFMDGIKKNEPNIMPFSTNSDPENNMMSLIKDVQYKTIGNVPYGLGIKYEKPTDVYSYWGSAEHLNDLKTMKRWMDKGFFPKNVLNQKDALQDQLTSGKVASILGDNPNRYNDSALKAASTHPEWKLAYHPYPLTTGFATPVHPIHNGYAIPKSSKNAERALAFYEKMVTDKRYNLLTQYGIEGKNYTVENGYYKMAGDASSNGFPREAMNGWAWRNPQYMLFDKGFDGVKAIFAELDKIQKPDLFLGFAEDYTSYQAERAALDQVVKQYLYPLDVGLVDNVEEGLKTFMEKAKQAGLEKIQAEYKKQWQQYTTEKGMK